MPPSGPTCEVVIRPFEPSDQDAVRELILGGLAEHFGWLDEELNPDVRDIAQSYLERGDTFLVAAIDGAPVGTGGLVAKQDGVGRIARMSVRGENRRCGIGRLIAQRLIEAARGRGLKRIEVETTNDWYGVIGFYESCGFRQYARDEVSVYMAMDLE